ncbi:MAG: DUF4864 domain-containing protein [Verrucomicrobia bacterium]|nr:DUF4864 domain-containing protein [Verrucomicrobiota bacterium]
MKLTRVFGAIILLLLICTPVFAAGTEFKPSDKKTQDELAVVVTSQLEAFRQNDYPKAYTFAATGIREKFDREAFEKMVKEQYPAIANSKSAKFGATADNGNEAMLTVNIRGVGKQTGQFRYLFVREKSKWKISGVVEMKTEGPVADACGISLVFALA